MANTMSAVFFATLLALMMSGCDGESEPAVAFSHGWARATPTGANVAAVYAQLSNRGLESVTILGISTSVARMAQVHETTESEGMMRMRHVDPLALAAGTDVDLVPGGMHLMLMGLTQPLTSGMTFDVTFELADGQKLTLPVVVGAVDQLEAPAM
ncbi:MAG: copper(I)-binding protein [Candidatus Pseudothioglobus sp.]|jgi:copper(I)-binding protein